MKAMILAAGLGTRLRPLTSELPKPLVPVNGRPVIEYTLLMLKRYRVTEVMINLHYHGQRIADALGSGSKWGLQISYSHETEILGTGGGLKKVQSFFSGERFVVINGDILVDLDLDRTVRFHRTKNAIATLVLREDPDAETWGAVEVDRQERICRIRGLPRESEPGVGKRMFTGIHILEPGIFRFMPGKGSFSIIDTYLEMIRKKETIAGYTMAGYWIDVGTPDRHHRAQEDLRQGTVRLSYLPDA